MEEKILNLIKEVNPERPLDYLRKIIKPFCLEKLNEEIKNCSKCGQCEKCFPHGSGEIMIIGDYPDKNQKGQKAFNNINGQYIVRIQKDLSNCCFINSISCVPKKRIPTKDERNQCKDILYHYIDIVKPKIIICLGSIPLLQLNEDIGKQNINLIRGEYFYFRGIKVLPTYSPRYIEQLKMKNINTKEEEECFISDIQKGFKC